MTVQKRKVLSTKEKLEVLVKQAICPRCNQRLGRLADLQWDHSHARARDGGEAVENFVALHIECHKEKTFGTKATSLGSDIHEIAKTRRLTKANEEFRDRLLRKDSGAARPKSRWPKRSLGSKKRKNDA